MNVPNLHKAQARLISASCGFVLACILVAGLWPFHPPRNAVSWLKGENGLLFGGHGSVVSGNPFLTTRAPDDTESSLELWLTPARDTNSGSILAFDSSPDQRMPFSLRQYGTSVAVHHYVVDDQGHVTHPWFKVNHVFNAGKRMLVTVTSNHIRTSIYVDGVLLATSSDASIRSQELTGRLVLANSTIDDSWSGQIHGLAIYDRELTPTQVRSHFESWTPKQGPSLTGEKSPIALYRFDEHMGNTIQNVVDPATSLTIPRHYFVLHPAFLRSTWEQYSHTPNIWKQWGFWQDLVVNIVGFMPVGFVFSAYFCSVKPVRSVALVVVLIGFFLSFTIEASQWFLPTRDSGMTDLLTNTAGTALGLLLYRSSIVSAVWTKAVNFGLPAAESQVQGAAIERRPPTQGEKPTFSV